MNVSPARRLLAAPRRAALAEVLALPLAGCLGGSGEPPPETVAAVDLARYAGSWFEISRFPNSFQDSRSRVCEETIASYTPLPDGTVGVRNRCLDVVHGGQEEVATASAYAVEGSGNSRLRVTFFWPFYGDYWVIGLDPDYRWAVVGTPGRDYLWILSRTPALSAGDYAESVGIARAQGFDVNRLRSTRQSGT